MSDAENPLPSLVFAHANGVPDHSYDTFLAPLADAYQIHVVPCLGHNPAYPVDDNWHSLSLELEAHLATLPKPLVGVGHSMGAVLMFLVAQRHPQWFSKLAMLDPPLINGVYAPMMRTAQLLGLQDSVTPAGKSKGRLDHWATWADVESYFRSRGLFKAFDPRCLDDYLHAGVEKVGGGYALRFKVEVEVAVFRRTPTAVTSMPRLQVPGTLITGRHSPKAFHTCGARHAKRHGMHHCYAAGSHMFPLEQPEATAELLRDALAQLESAQ